MLKLIKMNLNIIKANFALIFLCPLLYIYIVIARTHSQAMVYFTFMVIISLLTLVALLFNVKSEKTILMNSLPIDRSKYVISKYLVDTLFPLVLSILFYVYIFYIESSNDTRSLVNFGIIFFATSMNLLVVSIGIPLFYLETRVKRINFLGFALFLISVFLPKILGLFYEGIGKYEIMKYIFESNLTESTLISFFITIPIFLTSMKLSIKRYNKKEN